LSYSYSVVDNSLVLLVKYKFELEVVMQTPNDVNECLWCAIFLEDSEE
jgi:hypothetical protein